MGQNIYIPRLIRKLAVATTPERNMDVSLPRHKACLKAADEWEN